MNQSPPNDGTTTSGPEPTPGPNAGDGSTNSITLHTTVFHGSPLEGLSVESSDTKMKEDAKTSTTTALINKTDVSSSMVNIKPNPNVDIEIAWFQVITAIRRVSSLKQISGREFIILNGWGFLLLVLFNGALFAALAAVSIRYTKGFAPASDQRLALACLVTQTSYGIACGTEYCWFYNVSGRARVSAKADLPTIRSEDEAIA
ncbi:hypothetical protein SARC_12196 [Sphaeroforma arctica JP610]|uniref:Uncharacterized protein n=1 Tax=Sphaeroforma arctica JP610 TaxID=667725 RepID=A0A0L0FEU8_9EUKA|nr:hypothetical protein SARC_12196 [Sphaeroforma arctica JP610]KNC75275.1 hypothetical protein SARC_12196 [Sphaeroforma arctica JP610]|eukprot:XP_014149177.1 hypothetical protein SARC_12196 [Sphaeroforma arctica JP610]